LPSWLHELLSSLSYSVGLHNPGGLAILFLLGVFFDIGVPLFFSIETFLLFATFYVGPLSSQVFFIMLMLLLGRQTGASIFYWLSRLLGQRFLNWLNRHLPWITSGERKLKERISHNTVWVVVVVRLTPGLLQLPSLITGSMHLKYRSFAFGVVISSLVYDFGVILFGFAGRTFLGDKPERLTEYFFVSFIALIVLVWLIFFILQRRNSRKDKI